MNKEQRIATPITESETASEFFLKLRLNLRSTSTTTALIALSAATLALSFAAIFIKLSEIEISPNATVFNRLWIATIVLWLWQKLELIGRSPENLTAKIEPLSATYREKGLLILVAIVSSASVMFWAWSITQTSIANSTVLRNLTPLFTNLGGWLIFNQRFERKFVLGMILAVVGGVALGWSDWKAEGEFLIGDGLALVSAVCYAINLLIIGSVRAKFNTTTILLWRCGFGALFIFPLAWFSEGSLFPYSWQGWLVVIAFAVVCQVIGQGLLIFSLKQFSSSFVAVFLLSEPIITAILAWIIFDESLSWFNGVIFGLILIGIYLAKSSNSAKKAA